MDFSRDYLMNMLKRYLRISCRLVPINPTDDILTRTANMVYDAFVYQIEYQKKNNIRVNLDDAYYHAFRIVIKKITP